MLRCNAVETLVAREADGLLTPLEKDGLEAHAAGCERCRARREANLAVQRALALRVDAPVPERFAARVVARLASTRSSEWLDAVNWRRWTEWMLPVAAALLLVVGIAGAGATTSTGTTQSLSGESPAASVEAWPLLGETESSPAASALAQDVTSDELMATMLGTGAAEAEGKGNGR